MDHYRKLENMYHNHPLNRFYNAKLSIREREATLTIDVRPEFFHAAGAVHGSVYFKALDDAGFFAANSVVEDVFVLTTTFTTYLTRPISEGSMRAEGRLVYENRSQLIGEAVLYDGEGREIGRGSGMYIRSRMPLTDEIGYRL